MVKVLRRTLCILIASLMLAVPAMAASYNMYFHTNTKIYQTPSSSARSLNVPAGMKVKMVAMQNGWAMVKNGDAVAFCKLKDLNLSSRLKGYVSKSTPLYRSASTSSDKTGAIAVNTEVYVIGISGSFYRVQNESGSATGYMPMSCVSNSKVNVSSDWRAKVVAYDWYNGGNDVLKKGEYGTLYDIATGISIRVYRMGGTSHADLEPATRDDTEKLLKIAGGTFSWNSHPAVLIKDGVYAACAINTMPHGEASITTNGYDGQFCLHMINSRTHGSDSVNAAHQASIADCLNWASNRG